METVFWLVLALVVVLLIPHRFGWQRHPGGQTTWEVITGACQLVVSKSGGIWSSNPLMEFQKAILDTIRRVWGLGRLPIVQAIWEALRKYQGL